MTRIFGDSANFIYVKLCSNKTDALRLTNRQEPNYCGFYGLFLELGYRIFFNLRAILSRNRNVAPEIDDIAS